MLQAIKLKNLLFEKIYFKISYTFEPCYQYVDKDLSFIIKKLRKQRNSYKSSLNIFHKVCNIFQPCRLTSLK